MGKMQAQYRDDVATCESQMSLLESKIEDLNRSNRIETLRVESDLKKNLEMMKQKEEQFEFELDNKEQTIHELNNQLEEAKEGLQDGQKVAEQWHIQFSQTELQLKE